jgi:flagellar secretion chaperone FliS
MSSGFQDNPYLEQEVLSATPAKLRFMLLDRATSLVSIVDQLWASDNHFQAVQWTIRIRDILSELLNGVTDREMELSQRIADLYVFLINMLTRLEVSHSREDLAEFRSILELERETWQQFVRKEAQAAQHSSPYSTAIPPAHFSPHPSNGQFGSSDFNLEV